jgi:hypothetical protein
MAMVIGELAGWFSGSQADSIGGGLVVGCFAILFGCFGLATSAYGLVHGMIALDSSVTVTPAPIGRTDFATVGWNTHEGLRHSLIYESKDAIAAVLKWLASVLPTR